MHTIKVKRVTTDIVKTPYRRGREINGFESTRTRSRKPKYVFYFYPRLIAIKRVIGLQRVRNTFEVLRFVPDKFVQLFCYLPVYI